MLLTDEELAAVAKALAHPARLRILQQFHEGTPRQVKQIVQAGTLAQSTVSEHLRILRRAGLIGATREGSRKWYCMRRAVLEAFVNQVGDLTQVTPNSPEGL